MAGIIWTQLEDEFLAEHYGKVDKALLLANLNGRSWDAIKLHAVRLGLKFYDMGVHPYVDADLSPLLEDSPVAFYWMGFLMADGSFVKNRLKLTLAEKDTQHVVRFAEFISCRNHGKNARGYGITVQDGFTVPKILDKFKLKPAKTYNPPDIRWIRGELFVAFLIGFIDGDGCIKYQSGRKDCVISIKCHRSWLKNLRQMSRYVSEYMVGVSPARAYINKSGYAQVDFGNCVLLRFLKQKGRELQLPVLWRKWSKIDESRRSRREIAIINRENVLAMKQLGKCNKDVAEALDLSQACVSVIVKELKRKWTL